METRKEQTSRIRSMESRFRRVRKAVDALNNIGFVIYAQPNLDITESVIQDLNRRYRKNAKDPAGAAASEK